MTRPLTRARVLALSGVLLLMLAAVLALCARLGSSPLDLGLALDDTLQPNPDREILWGHRVPRVLMAAMAGGALAIVGAAFQALLRNPLADPYIVGVSGGAALGGSLAIAFGLTIEALPALSTSSASFAGALGALTLVYALAARGGRFRPYDLLLIGVIFNAFASALIMFIKTVVSARKAQEMLFWLMGSLNVERIGPTELIVTASFVGFAAALLLRHAHGLNLLTLGDESAASLGVHTARLRALVFVAGSLAIGAVVSITGLIGFVGLIVPHAARILVGPDHRILLPVSLLTGAMFLPLADLATRMLFPVLATETPVGVLTAFLGGPLFVLLLQRNRRARWSAEVVG